MNSVAQVWPSGTDRDTFVSLAKAKANPPDVIGKVITQLGSFAQWRMTRHAVLICGVSFLFTTARAAHYAGGSITYECIGPDQFLINLDLFLDCAGVPSVAQTLTFSSTCGTTFTVPSIPPPVPTEVSQLCAAAMSNSTCNGGTLPGIEYYHFETIVTLPPCDHWTVSWNICCRAATVDLVGVPGMYIEAEIYNATDACNNSPEFTDQSIPYVCLNQPVYYNFGVNEPDGDEFTYALINARYFAGTPQDVNYQPGFSGGAPVPGITLDPVSGQIVFTPTVSGNYVVAVEVEEYDVNGNLIGTVMRDIMFVVLPCTGSVPISQGAVNNTGGLITGTNSIEVCEGEAFCVDMEFTDADPGTVLQVVSTATAMLPGSTFTVIGTNPAIGRICWTGDLNYSPINVLVQADDGSCPVENTATVALNITTVSGGGPLPSPGTNGSVQVCPNSLAFMLIDELGGTPDPSGFWTGPSGSPHNAQFDPITDPAGVYTYTVGNSCASATSTVAVSYVNVPNPGTDGALSLCSNVVPVNLLTGLGGTPSAGGTWTAPGGGAFGGSYDPAVHGPGIYMYSVPALSGCPGSSATVTVTETPAPNAGINGLMSVCSDQGVTSMFGYLGGTPAVGGTWTAPGGGAFSGSFNPAVHAAGVYTYSVTGTPPCVNAQATVTVTINPVPNAGANGSRTVCSSAAPANLFTSLGGTPQAGGSWTDPVGMPHSNMYDPAVDGPGVYVYTVTGVAPCANAAATVTVTETPAPNAGADAIFSICSNGPVTNLYTLLGGGAQAGGTWTNPGGAAFSGSYDPTLHGPGIYTYTLAPSAPCPGDQATVTVTEPMAPNAGVDAVYSICSSNAATNLLSLLTGAQAGGTWTAPGGGAFFGTYDPAVHGSGVFTYTVNGAAPCVADQATVTVTENAAPNAGTDGALALCSTSSATGLLASLVGAQAGGMWSAPGGGAFSGTYDPAVHMSGVYTYTVPGISPCASDQATVTVTENAAPNAGTDGTLALCSSSAATGLFASLTGAQAGGTWTAPGGGAFTGTYDPAVDASGVYTYMVSGTAPCAADQATVTVTENAAPNAGTDGSLTLCSTSAATGLITSLTGAQAGGTWTAPGGGAFAGTYDPAVHDAGVYTYTVAGAAPCASDQATVTVTENAAPNAGTDGTLTLCSTSAATGLITSLAGAQVGGTWTAPAGGAFAGTYDPAVHDAGVYTYTVAGAAPCASDQATVTVTENAAPNAGTDGTITLCSTSAATGLFASLTGAQAGGSWTAPGGGPFTGTYDPAVDAGGVYTYVVSGTAPCAADQATVTVTENAAPNAGTDGNLTLCSTSAATGLFASLTGAQAGGTWTAPGGGAFNGTYDPSVNSGGVYTYTLNATAPCVSDQSTVTVTENTAPNAGADGSITICELSAPTPLFPSLMGADAGGSWNAPGGGAFSGTYDPVVNTSGVYTYSVSGTAPCVADQATVTVTETSDPDAGTDGSITLCSTSAATDLFASLSGADGGGTWTAPGGGAFSGTYDPSVNSGGVYTYTLNATAPCVSDQSTVTVTENAAPNAGVDGSITICDLSAPTGLFASLSGAQAGGTWTAPGGGAFSGTYDPAVNVTGVYTYSVAGTPPCAVDQAMVTVTETTSPYAGIDGAITLCSTSGAIALFASLTGAQAGGTWTAPGGGAFSGTYDPAVNSSGIYTYTLNATAPCVSDQGTVTVTELAAPFAGSDASVTLCDLGAPTALFASLTGADGGGTWTAPGGGAFSGTYDPAVNTSGVYAYSVVGTPPCIADQATVTVTETSSPNAGTDGAITLCSNAAPTSLFAQLGGGAQAGGTWTSPAGTSHTGTLDPAVDASGSYQYTLDAALPCVASTAAVMVTIEPVPDAGTNGSVELCTGDGPADLFTFLGGSPDAGGTWTAAGGGAFSGTFDPALDAPGTYTYSIGTAVCSTVQSSVQVTVLVGPDAGQGTDLALCNSNASVTLFNYLLGTPDPGGTWSAPGGGAFAGTLDPAIDPAGAYTYTVAGNATCPNAVAILNVSINAAVSAGVPGAVILCTTNTPQALIASLGGSPQPGGTWSAPDGSPFSGTIDPATDAPGLYTYLVQGPDPCPDASATVNVQLNQAADAGEDGSGSVCSDHAPISLITLLGGTPQVDGTWTGPDELPASGTFTPGVSLVGGYTYEVIGQGPCASDMATVTMSVSPAADAGDDGAITLCADADAFDLLPLLEGNPDPGGTWTYPDGSPCNGSVDPATDMSGAYTYTVVAPAPCLADQAVVMVTIHPTPLPEILVQTDGGCSPVTAMFTNGYDGPGTCYWTFGNDSTSGDCIPPPVVYDQTGSYTVTLTMDAGNGCTAMVTLSEPIEVVERPEAMFLVTPENLNTGAPQAIFQNGSTGAVSYSWQFDELGESEEAQPTFTFPSEVEGLYTVCLTAYANEACFDTACADVLVPAGAGVFVPNAFSPDGDGVNDTFMPIVSGITSDMYEFLVFDRYGQQLFRTSMIGEPWTGQFGDGTLTPVGVYIWKVTGHDRYNGQRVDRTGHVTLVR